MHRSLAEWVNTLTGTEKGSAATALASSIRDGEVPLELLQDLMAHPCEALRVSTAWSLYEASNSTDANLSAILHGLNDDSPQVRHWCLLALMTAAPASHLAVLTHALPALHDSVYSVRRAAVCLFVGLGRPSFESMLSADFSRSCGDLTHVDQCMAIRSELAAGYLAAEEAIAHQDASDGDTPITRHIGRYIRLAFDASDQASRASVDWSTIPADARNVWMESLLHLATATADGMRRLATLQDHDCEYRSWLLLDTLMVTVERWYADMPKCLQHAPERVRAAAISTLTRGPSESVVASALRCASQAPSASDGIETLRVIRDLLRRAAFVIDLSNEEWQRVAMGQSPNCLGTPASELSRDISRAFRDVDDALSRRRRVLE
jgi:hypothetical protein